MNPRILKMKEGGADVLPREKMLCQGAGSLSNAELLAILLRSGSLHENVLELSQRILSDCGGNLITLSQKTLDDFLTYEGIGETKALTIMAAMELGRRRRSSEVRQQKIIRNSMDVYEYIQDSLTDLDHEELWVIMLRASNEILDRFRLSSGGISSADVDVRLMLKKLISRGATAFVLCHNHPSEKLEPSKSDRDATRKIAKAAELLDIKLFDHLIVGSNSYYSFRDYGLIS